MIELKKIDRSNYEECINLKLEANQLKHVANNILSLVQSVYEENFYPLGIYNEKKMVGFILYDFDTEVKGWSMSRFMIDKNYQNQGLGTKALQKFLEFFKENYKDEKLYTSASLDNLQAIKLYEKFGFIKKDIFEYEINGEKFKEIRMILDI